MVAAGFSDWCLTTVHEGRVRVHRPEPQRCEPRRVRQARRHSRRLALAAEISPTRVLVAEDDPAMRQMLVEALREDGYQVIEVESGTQLARCLKDRRGRACPLPDLVLSDIRMPGYTGLEVLAELRRHDWLMPVILITAFGDDKVHEEARRLGAALVLNKPFDVDEMLHFVHSIAPPRCGRPRR